MENNEKNPNGYRTEHYEHREIPSDHEDAKKFSYKGELPITPEQLAQLGKEDGYLRFVRFLNEIEGGEAQTIVVDAKIGPDFAFDMARAIKGKTDVIELLTEALKLAEALESPVGPLVEIAFKARRELRRRGVFSEQDAANLCPCPKCTARREAEAVAATGNPDQVDPLKN